MRYKSQVLVLGMKQSKGTMENGTSFDSTKVYCVVDMDGSKGQALGKMGGEFPMGLSGEMERFRQVAFPFEAVGEFEMVGNGKTMKTVLVGLEPVKARAA